MNLKQIREAFLKSGKQLNEATERRKQAEADQALATKTRYLIHGLRTADMPVSFGNQVGATWLPVWNCRLALPEKSQPDRAEPSATCPNDGGGCIGCCPRPASRPNRPRSEWPTIFEVNALIVPEIIRPQDRPQPLRQNEDGSTTWSSQPFPRDKLVDEVIERYAEGRVTVGELAHAQTVTCRHCGQPALLVLEHTRDFDSDTSGLRLSELCLKCPAAYDLAFGATVDAHDSHPAFPYRKK